MSEETVTAPVDEKGRVLPEAMSDREMAIETLFLLRAIVDIFEGLGNHPMARSLGMAFPSGNGRNH
jgi:hypothetical protein